MKSILPITLSILFTQISALYAGDSAFSLMIMEASTRKSDPTTIAIDSPDEPGEIAFGIIKNERFIGQRFTFQALQTNTRKVQVTLEDVQAPTIEPESGLTTQQVHKKEIILSADGKTYTVTLNQKKFTFKIYAIGGVHETRKILIEQPSK